MERTGPASGLFPVATGDNEKHSLPPGPCLSRGSGENPAPAMPSETLSKRLSCRVSTPLTCRARS